MATEIDFFRCALLNNVVRHNSYSLSPELNDAIDRSRGFQEKRMAGEIFGNNLPGSIDIDSDPNTGLLYAAARGMGERLRNYKNG